MNKKYPIVSVDPIIVRGNKILLGKLSDKWTENGKYEYGIPCREIIFRDNFEKTIIKNLKEETGME